MSDDLAVMGFTGTRRAVTERQAAVISKMLDPEVVAMLVHGDCVGADATAHNMALWAGIDVTVFPPTNPNFRAWCRGYRVEKPSSYKKRNQAIVDACDWLLAVPSDSSRGTWQTVEMALQAGKLVKVAYPDGSVLARTGVQTRQEPK